MRIRTLVNDLVKDNAQSFMIQPPEKSRGECEAAGPDMVPAIVTPGQAE